MLFGLGLPEWLTIIGLVGGLILTFYVMARASVAYERKRQRSQTGEAASAGSQAGEASSVTAGEEDARKEEHES